jgi:hypothetical protein
VRERCDAGAARRVAQYIQNDARVARRLSQIAEREAGRLAGGPLAARAADVRVRAQGTVVYIDIDVEEQ